MYRRNSTRTTQRAGLFRPSPTEYLTVESLRIMETSNMSGDGLGYNILRYIPVQAFVSV